MNFEEWKSAYTSRKAILNEINDHNTPEAQAMGDMINDTITQMTDSLSKRDRTKATQWVLGGNPDSTNG